MMAEGSSSDASRDDGEVYNMMASVESGQAQESRASSAGRGSGKRQSAEISEAVQQAVLEHPKVKDAVRKSEKARSTPLADPAVQQQILSVCYERHPEVAEAAPAAIALMAKDPQANRQAQQSAGVVPALATVAGLFIGQNRGVDVISQGSPAVRFMAFIAGGASVVLSIFPVLNPLVLFTHPVVWCVHFYQLVFSATTLIFEAEQGWIRWLTMLDSYKSLVVENARFLAKCLGRGMFYIFQGSLWLCLGYSETVLGPDEQVGWFAKTYHIFSVTLGSVYMLLGFVHILMHWGIMPSHYVLSLNAAGQQASGRVTGALEALRARRAGGAASGAASSDPRQVEMVNTNSES